MFCFTYLKKRSVCLSIVLCIWACWLILYRYHGIYQDTYLYAFLAIVHQDPTTFQNDLFVKFGSQGSFSIFPLVYSGFIQLFGLAHGTLWLMITGQTFFFVALGLLVHRICPGWTGILCLTALILISPFYDPFIGFRYGEPFPTSRIFAESFCLLGINALWARHYVLTAILLLGGMLLHPLMAVLACALSGLVFITDRQLSLRLRFGCTSTVLGLGLIISLWLVRHSNLTLCIDTQWSEIIERLNYYLFPQAWTAGAVSKFVYFTLIFCLGWWLRLVQPRRILPALVGCMTLLLAVWLVGTGIYRNAFITQIQLWRGLWLFQVIGIIINMMVLARLWQGSGAQRWAAACMTLGLLSLGFMGDQPTTVPALMLLMIGVVTGIVLHYIPAHYLERYLWRMLPLALVVPEVFRHFAGNEMLRLGLALLLAGALPVSHSPRVILALFCTLCALGLTPLVTDPLIPALSLGIFLCWLVMSEKPQPWLVRPVCKIVLLIFVILLFVCTSGNTWEAAQNTFVTQVSPYLGSHFLLWEGLAIGFAVAIHGIQQRQLTLCPANISLPLIGGICSLTAGVCFWLPNADRVTTFPQESWVKSVQSQIPRQAVVLSDRGVGWSWFVLHRSFYASHVQLFGNVFSRQNAIEGYRRRQFLCNIDVDFCKAPTAAIRNPLKTGKELSHQDIVKLCSDPSLDYILLHGQHPDRIQVFIDNAGQPNSLIACTPMRNQSARSRRG